MFATHQLGRTAVNAILPKAAPAQRAADRTENLLAMLQRLADIGMQLAERAAEQALAEPPPSAESASKSRRRGPDPRNVFIRLSRFVRDTIALEVRLAAGKLPRAPRSQAGSQAAPRAVNDVADAPQPRPAKPGLREQLDALIAGSSTADPGYADAPKLSHKLSLACNAAKIEANVLNQPPRLVNEMERLAAKAIEAHRAAVEATSKRAGCMSAA
jgi:hypothetical protein